MGGAGVGPATWKQFAGIKENQENLSPDDDKAQKGV
jgi:hypothetical protein